MPTPAKPDRKKVPMHARAGKTRREFLVAWNMSESTFIKRKKQGRAPREVEGIITPQAEADWIAAREREAEAAE